MSTLQISYRVISDDGKVADAQTITIPYDGSKDIIIRELMKVFWDGRKNDTNRA